MGMGWPSPDDIGTLASSSLSVPNTQIQIQNLLRKKVLLRTHSLEHNFRCLVERGTLIYAESLPSEWIWTACNFYFVFPTSSLPPSSLLKLLDKRRNCVNSVECQYPPLGAMIWQAGVSSPISSITPSLDIYFLFPKTNTNTSTMTKRETETKTNTKTKRKTKPKTNMKTKTDRYV